MKTKLTTLENGLRIITTEMVSQAAVAEIFVKFGSKHETAETSGTAHFLEHVIFLGSQSRSDEQLGREFDEIAASSNGYTCASYTEFTVTVLKEDIAKALELYADMLLHPGFDEKKINNEKKVILQEKISVDQQIFSGAELTRVAFGSEKYKCQPIGSRKNIKSMSKEKLEAAWQKYYTAPNMIISIAGGIDSEEIVQLCRTLFAELSPKEAPVAESYAYRGGITFFEQSDTNEIRLAFDATDPKDSVAGTIMASILGGDYNSRIYNNIRKKYGYVYALGGSLVNCPYGYILKIFFRTSKEYRAQITGLVFREIIDICLNGVSEKELAVAKKKFIVNQIYTLESPTSCAVFFGACMAMNNQFYTAKILLEKINDVSVNEVRKVAQRIFSTRPTYLIYGQNLDSHLAYETICGMYMANVNKY